MNFGIFLRFVDTSCQFLKLTFEFSFCGWLPDMESTLKVVLDYELFDPGFIGKGALVLAESFGKTLAAHCCMKYARRERCPLAERYWPKSTM